MSRGSIPRFDLYEELEVSRQATSSVIEAAYRVLVKRHHPDVATQDDGDQIKRLNVAREWLISPGKRARYDAATALPGDAERAYMPAADRPERVYARRPRPAAGASGGASGGAERTRVSSPESFGVNSRDVRHFLTELRTLGGSRATDVLNAKLALDATAYAEARSSALAAARAWREGEWTFAREAAYVIARGKLSGSPIEPAVATIVADIAGAIVVRDQITSREFLLLLAPWSETATPSVATRERPQRTSTPRLAGVGALAGRTMRSGRTGLAGLGALAGQAARSGRTGLNELSGLAEQTVQTGLEGLDGIGARAGQAVRSGQAGLSGLGALAGRAAPTGQRGREAVSGPGEASWPADGTGRIGLDGLRAPAGWAMPTNLSKPVRSGPTRFGRSRRPLAIGVSVSVLIAVIAIAALGRIPKPETAIAALTDAPPSFSALVSPGVAAPSASTGIVGPILPGASPTPEVETPDATTEVDATPVPAGPPTARPPGPTPTPKPGQTPKPTPKPTPHPTPPPTSAPTPTPTPTPTPAPTTPPTTCTVINLFNVNTGNAQAAWNTAGFTGVVLFSPQPPPQYKIKWQSLGAGTSVPCTSDISVQKTAP